MKKVYKNVAGKYKDEKVKTRKGNNIKEKYIGARPHNMTVVLN